RSQTASASRVAHRMANVASTAKTSTSAAQALTIAGSQYDTLLQTLTSLVDDGPAQSPIASAIVPTIAGKQQIIDLLNQLLPTLPASAQPIVASIITALGAGDATPVVNLNTALDSGSLSDTITGVVTQALNTAEQAIQTAMGVVQSILPMLPVAAQGPIGAIVNQVMGIVTTLVPSVLNTVTQLISTVLGSLPFVGSTSTGTTGIFGGLLGGILGGGSGAGSIGNVGGIGSTITGLLGSLFGGSSSGAGAGGILSTVTGLINSLLGGILGGGGGLLGGAHA
ncbi:MAG TPA: hypothetical protein VGF63_12000, partial [Solirubrobacteraceae bacterium]